jgi:23S rRNA (cytosine1962-C5)-methyltransferase
MFAPAEYELLDFGRGRKLERFGAITLDRPSPAAEGVVTARPELWASATASFERGAGETGRWIVSNERGGDPLPESWTISHVALKFLLKPTDFGHIGLFPEQQSNWDWLSETIANRPLKVLNLFAYTGGSTLAAAAAGAEVVHIDAAKNVVDWARQNAALSGLEQAPIRWIVEDVLKFVRREVRRGNRYDGVILDPPSYGHGPKGEAWKIDDHLPVLLDLVGKLTAGNPNFMLATCHSESWDAPTLTSELVNRCTSSEENSLLVETRPLAIMTNGKRALASGVVAKIRTRSTSY